MSWLTGRARVGLFLILAVIWVLAAFRVASAANLCLGGATPGTACSQDVDCRGSCSTGTRSCASGTDCPGACAGGSNPGASCLDQATCHGQCIGGKSPGASCVGAADCPGGCTGNNSFPCTTTADCSAMGLGKCMAPAPGSCSNPAPGTCNGIGSCTTPSPGLCVSQAGPAIREIEPNESALTATGLAGDNAVATGNVYPPGDVDFYSFAALAGETVEASTLAQSSPGDTENERDTFLDLIQPDGSTLVESDEDDGYGKASAITGALLPSTGTYFLKVRSSTPAGIVRPYTLRLRVHHGAPALEIEPDGPSGHPLPGSGWISGSINPSGDADNHTIGPLSAGQTVALSLDLDPERDIGSFDGRVWLRQSNPEGHTFTESASGFLPRGTAVAFTVKSPGTYFAEVFTLGGTGGDVTATYRLSVSLQAAAATTTCTTYSSTDVPKSIADAGLTTSTLTIPGHPRIADLDLGLVMSHSRLEDVDLQLVSPAGNVVSLMTDIVSPPSPPASSNVNLDLDDEAAVPPLFGQPQGFIWQPERQYRLSWFDGEDAGGTWTLRAYDDTATLSGTLTGWSLKVCEPEAACPAGTAPLDIYANDFETGLGGFTHSGSADEWEWGLPTFTPVTGCNSGTHCWKTDLDNTYDAASSQDLLSPVIDLTGITAPLRASWAQKYQMEDAASDHAFAEIREAPAANPRKLFEFLDDTMTDSVGAGPTTVQESAGWGTLTADIGSFANRQVQLRFHLDSNASVNLAGLAIDDPRIFMCCSSITVGPATLPSAKQGLFYSQSLTQAGGAGPGTFVLASGTLPAGLSLSTGGLLSGTPSASGTFSLSVKWIDTTGCYGISSVALTVAVSPKEASPGQNMRVQKGMGTSLLMTYTPACDATNHVIYWGTTPIAGALFWTNALCNVGSSGTATFGASTPLPGKSLYFVIVGRTGTVEGSYGRNSAGVERPESIGLGGGCDLPRALAGTCP